MARCRLGAAIALIVGLAAGLHGCSAPPSAAGLDADASSSVATGGNSRPTDAASAATVQVVGAGGCPAKADAAICPAPPSVVATPSPPPNEPAIPNAGSYWVGCQLTSCSSATSCTTCACVDADGGADWDCSTGGIQPDSDAQPTPYCALYGGPLDGGDLADVGPFEQCTPQYPTCVGPLPESPGSQCCLVSNFGGLTEIQCMPNDAGPYSGGFAPPPHP